MIVTLEYENALYSFSRDHFGEGRWVCVRGKNPGGVGALVPQTYVHLELNNELTRVAVANGLGDHKLFSRFIKKEKPEKTVRSTRPRKKTRKSGVIGGISLASLFDTGHDQLSDEELPDDVVYEEID